MNETKYELRILPLFETDLNEIVDYICNRLENPIAADAFVDAVREAILHGCPTQNPSHRIRPRKKGSTPITQSM